MRPPCFPPCCREPTVALMYGAELDLAVRGIRRLVEDVVACLALILFFSGAGPKPVAVHTGAPRGAAPAQRNTATERLCTVPRGPLRCLISASGSWWALCECGSELRQHEKSNFNSYLRCLTGRAGGCSAASLSGPEAMTTT